MLVAPASPRAITKRIFARSCIASRIGMLWMEITPKAAWTPHSSRKRATAAPTVMVFCSGMVAEASGNVDVGTRRVRGQRRGQEEDRLCRFARQAQALERDALAGGELAGPGGPVLRLVLARFEAAAPLARLDEADEDAVDAHAERRELGGQRAHQVLQSGAG